MVIVVSTALNLRKHTHKYPPPTRACHAMVYTGNGPHGWGARGHLQLRRGGVRGGCSATLSEFDIAYGGGKVIGALPNTSCTFDHLDQVIQLVP
jgi:hypothetical protein